VLGSIYMGIATATEAAAFGVVGALTISALQRSLTYETFMTSLLGATRTSSMIALILAGATFLTLSMGYTGLPRSLAAWIGSLALSPSQLLFALALLYIVLGCLMDGISAILLTMGIVAPIVQAHGFDMVWFGIFLVILVEIAQITPPVGFNLFVLQQMTGHDIGYIALKAAPMLLIMCLALVILAVFPGLATYLPDRMMEVQQTAH
jgi:tripartite ATP-independent transporter DctM subunit